MDKVIEAARLRADDAVALLRRWVETSSFTGAVDDVNQMGARLEEAFGAIPGLALTVQPGEGVGDHRCWRTAAWDAQPERGVLLVGHCDTVFPPGTFEGWHQQGDRVTGPGTLDMKGGLVIIHTALAALADADALASLPLALVIVADEEIGSPDSAPFLATWARGASAALVFEAGRAHDAIITQRKGTGGLTVVAAGKAAHAGNHHADGVNAIVALSRLIVELAQLTDYERGLTVNVGLVSGGTSRNTVPARAECGVDFRYERAADGERLVADARRLAARVASATGATIEVGGGVRRPPLERTEASVALYEAYAAAARASGLGGPESPLLGGGSDGNNVAALGVPVIDGLGPRGAGFHTHDEYIELSSLPMRTEALIRFLLAYWQ